MRAGKELPESHAAPLLGPNDPPPFDLINPDGQAKVLLACDHASNTIPASLGGLGLAAYRLRQHIAYDIGSRDLTCRLSEMLDAPAVMATYSRLVVDLNRSLTDPGLIPEVSDGIPIPGNQGLTDRERNGRIHHLFTPYRKAIDGFLHEFHRHKIAPALIAIHSFTPRMDGFSRPWQIGILWDKDPRIAVPLMDKLRARREALEVGDNEPYSGKHPADYTIDHHAESRGIPHVSIEVRQDLVGDEDGIEHWANVLYEALRDILADPGIYTYWQHA